MITYQQENVSDLWGEVMPLLEAHWKEIAHYPDIPLEPDTDAYAMLEDAGAMRCYTVRSDGALIGYAVFLVRSNAHYKSSLQAVQDVLFLLPEHRNGKIGVGLIFYSEDRLTEEGVQVVFHHVKTTNNFGKLLTRLEYELVDQIYAKRLDKEIG